MILEYFSSVLGRVAVVSEGASVFNSSVVVSSEFSSCDGLEGSLDIVASIGGVVGDEH